MNIQDFKNYFSSAPNTKAIIDKLNAKVKTIHLKGLIGSSSALTASAVLEKVKGTHLFVLNDKEEAVYFMNDLQALNPDKLKVLFYPRSARVAYQVEKTENANISMRAEVLNEINKKHQQTIIVSFPEALAENVVTKKLLSKNTFDINIGETYDMEFIDEAFHEFGFVKVDYVFEPGQYSVRGGIVDVFSYSFDYPYRIEFFDDEVESIRKFEPVSQLSVNKMTRATIVPHVGEKMLHDSRESFFEFMPPDAITWYKDYKLCAHGIEKELKKAENLFENLESELNHLPPSKLYIGKMDFLKQAVN